MQTERSEGEAGKAGPKLCGGSEELSILGFMLEKLLFYF